MGGEHPVNPEALREQVRAKYRRSRQNPDGPSTSTPAGRWRSDSVRTTPRSTPCPTAPSRASPASATPSRCALPSRASVIDVGSGAGFDSFVAAGLVTPSGRVVGVDMTDEMLESSGLHDVVIGPAVDTFGGAGGESNARAFEVYGYAFLARKGPAH